MWEIIAVSILEYTQELIVSGVLAGVGIIFRRQIKGLMGRVMARLEDALINRVEDKLLERLDERWTQRLDKRIEQRLTELQPPPPPHGITGTPCPKTGSYRAQGRTKVERTFEEGEVFASVTVYSTVQKVVWVYQHPI